MFPLDSRLNNRLHAALLREKSSAWLLLHWPYIPPFGLSIGVSSRLMSPTTYNYAVFILPGAPEGKTESPSLIPSLSDSYYAVISWLVTSATLLPGSPGLQDPSRHQDLLQAPRMSQAPTIVLTCSPTSCIFGYSKFSMYVILISIFNLTSYSCILYPIQLLRSTYMYFYLIPVVFLYFSPLMHCLPTY